MSTSLNALIDYQQLCHNIILKFALFGLFQIFNFDSEVECERARPGSKVGWVWTWREGGDNNPFILRIFFTRPVGTSRQFELNSID